MTGIGIRTAAKGGCSEVRGIDKIPFIEGVKMSNMKEFSQWTVTADKVLTF
jgi:sulfur relay (sulfurtransferase) complex TusBCD TusD component (DsrE family)